ncbi:MAG TPA: hypothetical protein VGA22_12885 [Gemmatimonadales bacterium]
MKLVARLNDSRLSGVCGFQPWQPSVSFQLIATPAELGRGERVKLVARLTTAAYSGVCGFQPWQPSVSFQLIAPAEPVA